MTDNEIEAIAQEYAEATVAPISQYYLDNLDERNRKEDLKTVRDDIAIPLLKWLSDRYEIVSKERIREEYDNAKTLRDLYISATCINEMESRAIDHSEGRMYELIHLFPQTFKKQR